MSERNFRRTKIIATLGPASSTREEQQALVEAGVSVFRLNFSHGTHAEKLEAIKTVRQVAADTERPVAILQDLQGPKLRVGPIPFDEMDLIKGQDLCIYGDDRPAGEDSISINYPGLSEQVRRGDLVFIDDGLIELRVVRIKDGFLATEVVIGGNVRARQGVNLPRMHLTTPSLTEKDREDLIFGIQHGVDMVALSFVRSPSDVEPVRAVLKEFGVSLPICAKVERREALDEIEGVVREFDMVMVARGDLGVNLRPEKVPTAQKRIIKSAMTHGKPVITATQMLESMTYNRIPTRAEASDVANAVLDGTDAVMLSGETAIGAYPRETVETMDRIVREAEAQAPMRDYEMPRKASSMVAFCHAAVQLARNVGAAAIGALTRSGENAQVLSMLRPGLPVIALCEEEALVNRLSIFHSVMPVYLGPTPAIEEASETIRREIAGRGLLPEGSKVVIVGVTPGLPGTTTDFIRLVTV